MFCVYSFVYTLIVFNKVLCHHEDFSSGYHYHKAFPQEVMVDVINNFGVALLEAHNEDNNNNIALSPYGATSVLIALGEGIRGYAVEEIQEALRVPQDVAVIRVGLRDIHRHLKSYFIPREGFLAGLTLNNEKIQLNDEYKEILRFYGFDLDSFNSPLYPDAFETSTAMVLNVTDNAVATTGRTFVPTETIFPTEAIVPTVTGKNEEDSLLTTSGTSSTEQVQITTERTTKIQTRSTDSLTTITTESAITTSMLETTSNEITEKTTSRNEDTTTLEQSITSTTPPSVRVEIITTVTTSIPTTTSTESTITLKAETTTTENVPTTEIVKSTTEIPSETTTDIETTTEPRITTEILAQTTTISDGDQTSEDLEATSTEIVSNNDDSSTEITTATSEENKERRKRTPRAIVDYIIARHYDNQLHKPTKFSNSNNYEPEENLSFLIYGTVREPNIKFMTYDAVLPMAYVPPLNAMALSFPLDSKEYYLLLILPVDEMGIDKLIHDMAHTVNLGDIITSLRYAHVRAIIPSFMLKGYVVLTHSLQKLGIQRIFEPRRTDFSLMTKERDVYVTNIEQAVTVTIRNYVDADNLPNYRNLQHARPILFQADHPFLYFVMDTQIHVALMAGKIVNPLNSRIR